jgi:hypothetical protein
VLWAFAAALTCAFADADSASVATKARTRRVPQQNSRDRRTSKGGFGAKALNGRPAAKPKCRRAFAVHVWPETPCLPYPSVHLVTSTSDIARTVTEHLHVAIVTVHPESFRNVTPYFDQRKLADAGNALYRPRRHPWKRARGR